MSGNDDRHSARREKLAKGEVMNFRYADDRARSNGTVKQGRRFRRAGRSRLSDTFRVFSFARQWVVQRLAVLDAACQEFGPRWHRGLSSRAFRQQTPELGMMPA